MLAVVYLAIMVAVGDVLSRRFYRFEGWPHRLATSFLVGLLVSSPLTYLAALSFARTASPLLWANLLYFVFAAAAIYWLHWRSPFTLNEVKAVKLTKWDWLFLVALFIFACWLMFETLSFRDGKFFIGFKARVQCAPHIL